MKCRVKPVRTFLMYLGRWVLAIPILVIAPLKFFGGTIIGLWAYSVAKKMPVEPAYS
jgi:hypothetical protein